MDSAQIDQWSKEFVLDVDREWAEHGSLDNGYAVFYSPVHYQPKLLIVGFNPGGDASSFSRELAKIIPSQHEYIYEQYAIAKKMRTLFESIEQTETLTQSVKTNILFFRSPSISHWNKIEPSVRKTLENFCNHKVQELIATLKPKYILAEGIKTYTHLRQLLECKAEDQVIKSKNRTLFASTETSAFHLLGVIHPTGARISTSEWKIIGQELKRCLGKDMNEAIS